MACSSISFFVPSVRESRRIPSRQSLPISALEDTLYRCIQPWQDAVLKHRHGCRCGDCDYARTSFSYLSLHALFNLNIFSKTLFISNILLLGLPKMENPAQYGLEVAPHAGPEIAPQPDGNTKYSSGLQDRAIGQQDRPSHSYTRRNSPNRAFWAFAAIAVVCLAVGLGAGLGGGLAAQKRSKAATGAHLPYQT